MKKVRASLDGCSECAASAYAVIHMCDSIKGDGTQRALCDKAKHHIGKKTCINIDCRIMQDNDSANFCSSLGHTTVAETRSKQRKLTGR